MKCNKLLLDEAKAMISLLNKYIDNANLNVEKRQSLKNTLEAIIDNFDAFIVTIKDNSNNNFNK